MFILDIHAPLNSRRGKQKGSSSKQQQISKQAAAKKITDHNLKTINHTSHPNLNS